jgi:hypothetical protein|tara:strand:- start:221 stop:460 length:240 start_codon:yes stop_codon:yes gene_type:complete
MIGAIVLQSIRFIGKAVNKNNNQNFGSWLVFGSDGTLDLILLQFIEQEIIITSPAPTAFVWFFRRTRSPLSPNSAISEF